MNALKSALFGVDCKAPVLPASQATYASWEIVACEAGSTGALQSTPNRALFRAFMPAWL